MFLRFLVVFLVVLTIAGCSFDEPNAVVAKFKTENAGCTAPCKVDFIDVSENKGVYQWKYQWAFKDSTGFSTEQNASYQFTAAGVYRITLTLSNEKYGSSTFEDTLRIVASKPVADFSVSGGACQAPCEVSFQNTSKNALSYQWDFGDGTTLNAEQSPKHTYKNAGSFKVTLTASQGQVKDTISKTVTIAAGELSADFTYEMKDSAQKDSVVVIFTNTSKSATSYIWNFGDGSAVTNVASPTHTYVKQKTDKDYKVVLTAKAGSLSKEKNQVVKIRKKQ